ncbi:MAG TPA: hypothetical protein VEK79_01495 [Thermoanaerobaculia bacterium]|nr:hypothetical protein [Thermoanaerobaculia bacterium]
MKSLFDPADREAIVARINTLGPDAVRQWGTMDSGQMLCHCSRAIETATGDRPMKQKLLGKILMPFIRSAVFGEKPFGKNGPTDPTFVVTDPRDLATERARLLNLIAKFAERGQEKAGHQTHGFFGKMTGREWGELMYKHIDPPPAAVRGMSNKAGPYNFNNAISGALLIIVARAMVSNELRARISAHAATTFATSSGSNGFFTTPWILRESSFSSVYRPAPLTTSTMGTWAAVSSMASSTSKPLTFGIIRSSSTTL